MDAATRKTKLLEVKADPEKVVMTGIPLRYKGRNISSIVYRIPLDFLIYNKYNGRIGSAVLSYEKQNGLLNAEQDEDRVIIEKYLYESKEDRNKRTMDSLIEIGQQRYGIVTADGTIIDGNRRAMLLNRIYHNREALGYTHQQVEPCQYFLAIILPDDATERDIHQLETIYQMGEDDKLDYNPIEKYLKCKELKNCGFTEKDIAGFMCEKQSQIEQWLRILDLMEEYLKEYDYDGIYTRLEKTEGPFVDLANWLESYKRRGANVQTMDWDYSDSDISDLKLVCFDYIRARYEGKEFRAIGATGKAGSLFFHKDLWDSFLQKHIADTPSDEKTVQKFREEYPDESDLSKLLKKRDADWKAQAEGQLRGNLQRHSRKLDDQRAANRPGELIERALSALQAVDTAQAGFYSDPHIEEMIKEINRMTWEMKKQFDRR